VSASSPPIERSATGEARQPRRKDAERNRAAILAAARELFSRGRDVPMYEIGRRAGVGQATLYRHFPDRAAIVAAITREHVERVESAATAEDGEREPAIRVLDASAEMLVAIHDLLGILREDVALAPILDGLRAGVHAALATALERSPAPLRAGVDANDLMFVLKMVNGALVGVSTTAERRHAAQRALDLAVNGLRERR
jgi:AcrR family transcriptional regulator